MSFTSVINSKNTFGSGNNTYKYDFIQGNLNIPPDSEVMVANVQIPYSFIILHRHIIIIHFSLVFKLLHILMLLLMLLLYLCSYTYATSAIWL